MSTHVPPPVDLSFLRDRGVLKRIAVITVAFAAAGLLYATFAPKWYRSSVTLVSAKPQRGGVSSMLSGDLGALAGGFEGALGGADVSRIAAVLKGTAVTDAVIERFGLKARYGYAYQESTRNALWSHCDVKALTKPSLVELTCEDKDRKIVQDMLAFFAEYGNHVFRRVGVSSATEEVRFLEAHVTELRQAADEASERMLAFEREHQIVDLETQSKAVVSVLATLNSQRVSKQLELDYAKTFSAGDEATMRQLRSQLAVIDGQVRDLETVGEGAPRRTTGSRDGNGMFPAALAVPKLRAEYEKLYRDRRISEATLVFALERLELARATEARDVSTFVVLDPPALPDRHARPKRLPLLAISGTLGIVFAVAFEAWRSRSKPGGGGVAK